MLYLQIAIPIEAIVKISPIAEPYALLARLYTSQKGEPKKDTLLIFFHDMGNQPQVSFNKYIAGIQIPLGRKLEIMLFLLPGQWLGKTAGGYL